VSELLLVAYNRLLKKTGVKTGRSHIFTGTNPRLGFQVEKGSEKTKNRRGAPSTSDQGPGVKRR